MDSSKFETWINNGLGRAVLWLQDHPWQPHADAIAHVCLHTTAYDPQCEGSRAEYVHEIVALTNDWEHFASITVEGLLNAPQQYWDTVHMLHLTRLFAQQGYAPAREALYAKFHRNDSEEPFPGDDQIVALDGVKGLLFVLDRIGQHLTDHPAARVSSSVRAAGVSAQSSTADRTCGSRQGRYQDGGSASIAASTG